MASRETSKLRRARSKSIGYHCGLDQKVPGKLTLTSMIHLVALPPEMEIMDTSRSPLREHNAHTENSGGRGDTTVGRTDLVTETWANSSPGGNHSIRVVHFQLQAYIDFRQDIDMVPYRLLAPVFFNDPQPQRTALELEERLLSVPDKYSDHEFSCVVSLSRPF